MSDGQRGGFREGAGSHPLGGKGTNLYREVVQLLQNRDGVVSKMGLSMLPAQKEHLKRIGNGNYSEGFRRVFGVAMMLVEVMPFLDEVGELVMLKGDDDMTGAFKLVMESTLR